MKKKTLLITGVSALALSGFLAAGCGTSAQANETPRFNSAAPEFGLNLPTHEDDKKKDDKSNVTVNGEGVDNIRPDRNQLVADFCRNSKLPAGEGKDNKGGTCVSQPIGEVAKNPVRVAVPNAPSVVPVQTPFTLDVKVEDRDGPLDLNAFTFDPKTGKAGDTFLESPGELDAQGRPLLHCHLGVSTLTEKNGLPGESYDAAFKGLQGVKGDLKVTVDGLDAGFYRADVYCSSPGHAPLVTATATNVQAFASFNFQVN